MDLISPYLLHNHYYVKYNIISTVCSFQFMLIRIYYLPLSFLFISSSFILILPCFPFTTFLANFVFNHSNETTNYHEYRIEF